MVPRQNRRRKNGKTHRYFSVVENRRTAAGTTTQRQVLYLGEINDSQQEAWRRTLRVFDEGRGQYCELSLFPDDRPLPPGAANAVSVRLDRMELRRPRSSGDCWLGCWLWERLHLSSFWEAKLAEERGDVPWAKVLQLLVVNRLIEDRQRVAYSSPVVPAQRHGRTVGSGLRGGGEGSAVPLPGPSPASQV